MPVSVEVPDVSPAVIRSTLAAVQAEPACRDIQPSLVLAIAYTESRMQPGERSRSDARGIMQVVPRYHPEVQGLDLYDLHQGLRAGCMVFAKYVRLNRGDIRRALFGYSGRAPGYAAYVLRRQSAFRAYTD